MEKKEEEEEEEEEERIKVEGNLLLYYTDRWHCENSHFYIHHFLEFSSTQPPYWMAQIRERKREKEKREKGKKKKKRKRKREREKRN